MKGESDSHTPTGHGAQGSSHRGAGLLITRNCFPCQRPRNPIGGELYGSLKPRLWRCELCVIARQALQALQDEAA